MNARFPQSWGRIVRPCGPDYRNPLTFAGRNFSILSTFIPKTHWFLATPSRRSSFVKFRNFFGGWIDLLRKDKTPPKIIAWNAFWGRDQPFRVNFDFLVNPPLQLADVNRKPLPSITRPTPFCLFCTFEWDTFLGWSWCSMNTQIPCFVVFLHCFRSVCSVLHCFHDVSIVVFILFP